MLELAFLHHPNHNKFSKLEKIIMTDHNHNALSFKNEDLLQISFSKFLAINPLLSIANAMDAFSSNLEFLKNRLKHDSALASRLINQAIAAR